MPQIGASTAVDTNSVVETNYNAPILENPDAEDEDEFKTYKTN
jgi:hypothetical protein